MPGWSGSGTRGRGCGEVLSLRQLTPESPHIQTPLVILTEPTEIVGELHGISRQCGTKGAAANSVTCPEASITSGVRNERVNVP